MRSKQSRILQNYGSVFCICNSSRHRANTAPTTYEYVAWASHSAGTTKSPKLVISIETDIISGEALFSSSGNITAIGHVLSTLNFLAEPSVTVRAPVATHVTVKSPTNSYTADTSEATKIERIVQIVTGDEAVCQSIAEELIVRWGRQQVSVSGVIPLDVRLKFKEKIHIKIPQAGIDEPLTLQRKEHDIIGETTSIVCGDIILDDSELIARIDILIDAIVEQLNKEGGWLVDAVKRAAEKKGEE